MNMMSTELVIIEEPRVVRSYQDILDRKSEGLEVLFMEGYDETLLFSEAEEGSREAAIWQQAHILSNLDLDGIGPVWNSVKAQRMIGIWREWIGKTAANFGITKTRELGLDTVRCFVAIDETKSFTNGYMYFKSAPSAIVEYIIET